MAISPPTGNPPQSKAAERDAAQQDGFLREVDEALREEQLVDAFRRYAKPVGAALAVGLLALAGYLFWDNSVKDEAALRSEKAMIALDKVQAGQLDAAAKDFEALAKDGPDAMRTLALMNLAAIASEQGKVDEAAKRFTAIAADTKAPKLYRDLATVREVTLRYDTMKPDEVIAKLKPIAVPGNAYFGSAGELLAMAYLDGGKPDQAGALFAQIGQDKNVPQSVRVRVRQIASGLGYDGGIDLPTDAPADTAGPAGATPAAPAAPASQKPA
ncbi:MAG: tetratricopeptide repeat protein [Novosphingobium sp.]